MRKVTIRSNTFETNSSSMHSIAVKKHYIEPTAEEREKIVEPYLLEDRRIDLAKYMPGSYGFGPEVLDSFITKLPYIFSSLFEGDKNPEENQKYKFLLEAIGVEKVNGFNLKKNTSPYGITAGEYKIACIDHQSTGMISESLPCFYTFEYPSKWVSAVRRLLYDDDLFILIDNDNGDTDLRNKYDSLDRAYGLCQEELDYYSVRRDLDE